jgi:uncharacterized protein (DUF1778 family)
VRDAVINLRVLPEQRDLIEHAASLLGKNRADFILEAACERAQAVVVKQVFLSRDADKFKRFTARLDAPPGPNPRLERLMAVKAPWSTPWYELVTKRSAATHRHQHPGRTIELPRNIIALNEIRPCWCNRG